MNHDFSSSAHGWRSAPLCVSYALVVFETLPINMLGEGGPVVRHARWALGVADGQIEVLGVWVEPETELHRWQEVFAELKVRGVGAVGLVLGSDLNGIETPLAEAYPSAELLWLHVDRPQQDPLILASAAAVAYVEHAARRAIGAHRAFADFESAEDFVVRALRRAERRAPPTVSSATEHRHVAGCRGCWGGPLTQRAV